MNGAVAVVLLTYNRKEYAIRTLKSLMKNLKYSGKLHVHIADDGSPDGYLDDLRKIAKASFTGTTNSERKGYGCNYNLATQIVHQWADYVMPIEDDWELTKPLDLDELVNALKSDDRFGCIRLGYIGWTQELRGTFVGINGRIYLALDPDSPEPHVFAGHPRLETVQWQRNVGPWPEGELPGQTEFDVAHTRNARVGVLWPADIVHPSGDLFVHIGTERSY